MTTETALKLPAGYEPQPGRSVEAVPPPGLEPGYWAGSPSAVRDGEDIVLAYRLRRPVGSGRGYAVVVARSRDGVNFEQVSQVTSDQMGCESLERPALVKTPMGTWRLYLSCATWNTKHWRVELLEAPELHAFDPEKRVVVLPGDSGRAVKDPVIVARDGIWHLWASVHPLTEPGHTDRMTTDYATSADGVEWTWHGHALTPRPGHWDARGVRVSAVQFDGGQVIAHYDGRATAEQNYEERTGIAAGPEPSALTSLTDSPAGGGADGTAGLRYVSIVDLPAGGQRWYYELTRPDGLHSLVTELR